MSRVWSDYPRTSFCDIHQFIYGEKRQGEQQIRLVKTFKYKVTKSGIKYCNLYEKRKAMCKTNHAYQGHLQIKIPLVLILQMNQ